MTEPIVSTVEPVTLVGGAQFAPDELKISLKIAPILIGVDGGANALFAQRIQPRAVIGDLDSICDAAQAGFADILHHVAEQDTTDFEKALLRIESPLMLAVGFQGARLDHTLSVLNVMARHARRRVVLVGPDDLAFVIPGQIRLPLPVGTRLSMMPLGAAKVTTRGLRWEQTDVAYDPAGHTSPSNETAASVVTLQARGPVLAVVPRAHLGVVTDAVLGR